VWCSYAVYEPVFAACRTPAGRWLIIAPGCRDLSGRTGVRRIAVLDEPAAGETKVIRSDWSLPSDRRMKITESCRQMIASGDEPPGKTRCRDE
jgi:hypothetical protein